MPARLTTHPRRQERRRRAAERLRAASAEAFAPWLREHDRGHHGNCSVELPCRQWRGWSA